MNRQFEPVKRKWDENAIDSAYEDLLDTIGQVLDRSIVSGCSQVFRKNPALRSYLKLLSQMETELLIQWKIKQEKGLQAVLLRHRSWLSRELRKADGFFSRWNNFRSLLWKATIDIGCLLSSDPWRSLLIWILTDAEQMADFKHGLIEKAETTVLQQVCSLFELLYKTCPYHQALSFLNLIEIGADHRPEINPIGKQGQKDASQHLLMPIQESLSKHLEKDHWEGIPEKLLDFWKTNSGGTFSLFPAYLIKREGPTRYSFEGILPERWIVFDDLIGIEQNIEKLVQNTESFLMGDFAHHTLLWGGRGTGKSSSVLALLAKFAHRGLRLMEIRQENLDLIPKLSNYLRKKPEKFILFCDDLSFDQKDVDYKHLKTIMEGSVLSPANNLLFVATANKKDLVFRGDLDERNPEQKQLIDEKRAIDDRFGLKLFYEIPVFKQLEEILFRCADKTSVKYDAKILLAQFHQFAQKNNHDQPSGRTVQQFINEWVQHEQKQN